MRRGLGAQVRKILVLNRDSHGSQSTCEILRFPKGLLVKGNRIQSMAAGAARACPDKQYVVGIRSMYPNWDTGMHMNIYNGGVCGALGRPKAGERACRYTPDSLLPERVYQYLVPGTWYPKNRRVCQ